MLSHTLSVTVKGHFKSLVAYEHVWECSKCMHVSVYSQTSVLWAHPSVRIWGCLHGSSFVDLCRASSPSWFDGSESKLWNTLAFFCMLVSYRVLRILHLAWGIWVCPYTLVWAQEYTHTECSWSMFACVLGGAKSSRALRKWLLKGIASPEKVQRQPGRGLSL